MIIQNKLPPHNINAEQSVIGSVLIDGQCINTLSLAASDFYSETLQYIYGACLKLKSRGVSINQITVAEQLERDGKLQAIGGAAYLSQCIAEVPTSLDVEFYAEIVHRHSVYRRLIGAGNKITDLGYGAAPGIAETLNEADSLLLDIRKEDAKISVVTPSERVSLLGERYEKLYKNEAGMALGTGLIDLDKAIGGGFYAGDFIVIGARPGVGKTTLLQGVSNYIGQVHNVLFCSGEMDVASMSDRDVAGITGVPITDIRLGRYSDDLYATITGEPFERISGLKVYYFESSRSQGFNTANIYQAATQMKLRHGLDAIVIDYLGLLTDRYGTNQNERLGFITRSLKEMARNFEVPLLVAHQLSRALEGREDKRPMLWDLRESGNVEQDADIVLFIYRESYYDKESRSSEAEILIAKHRQGDANKCVKVYFDSKHHQYRDLAKGIRY